MFYCGIDLGSTFLKCVVLDSTKNFVFKAIEPIAGDPEETTKQMLAQVQKTLKIKRSQLNIEITGRNSEHLWANVESQSEFKCIAAGVGDLLLEIKTIVDMGSFSNKALIVKNGKIVDYIVNDICSSGSGVFLELVCKSLAISLDELATLALEATHTVSVTSQCSIFAESEVIYLMNEGHSMAEISAGVCHSIVGRLIPMISKLKPEMPIVFIGGVAKNRAIKFFFEQATGFHLSDLNLDPQILSAYGAALIAMKNDKAGGL